MDYFDENSHTAICHDPLAITNNKGIFLQESRAILKRKYVFMLWPSGHYGQRRWSYSRILGFNIATRSSNQGVCHQWNPSIVKHDAYIQGVIRVKLVISITFQGISFSMRSLMSVWIGSFIHSLLNITFQLFISFKDVCNKHIIIS